MAKHKKRAKHKRAHHRRAHRYHATNRFRTRRRRRHHSINPFRSLTSRGIGHDVTAALIGAAGAVGTDVAMAYAAPYLPASLQSGWLNLLTRAAAAVGVGFVAGKVAGRDTGKAVTAGGLIVVAYSGLKQALAPTLGSSVKGLSGLADFGDYVPYGQQSAAMVGSMGAYMARPMGAYMQPRLGAYMNPAAFVGGGGGAAMSPIRAKQMSGFRGFGNIGGEYQADDGAMM